MPDLRWIALCIGCCVPLCAVAQKDTASLTGLVTDKTGAVVAGADVEAVQSETNQAYRVLSDGSGNWSIGPVRIGTYHVAVSAKGFRKAEFAALTLDVQQRQRLDVSLEPGQATETVNVSERAALLESETSERSQLVDSKTMASIPLNGRNPVQLAQLTAGVTTSEPGSRDEGGYGFSANGARSLDNNFLLDGIDNNSNLPDLLNETNYVVMPSVDALQEFRVMTNSYSAEFGRATGAVVNATVKSGTNEFHGVVYEFLRNQLFDAKNYFDATRPPYHQNQFGATFGGPIVHNRLFFFVDYEGLRISEAQTSTSLVPTVAQRTGDFSSQLNLSSATGVADCNGNATYAGELFDTAQTRISASSPTGYCGTPFGYAAAGVPSNIIPKDRIDALGARLAALYPLPNVAASGYNYASNPVLTRNRDQGDVRVDHVIGANDSAFYRFSMSRQPATLPGPFPGLADGGGFFTGIEQNNGYSLALSETHIFSPKRINEVRLGYNRLHSDRLQFNYNTDVSGDIGFPGVPYQPGASNGGLPQMTFSDMSTLGSPTYLPSNEIQNTYSLSDTFTLVAGRHSFKFGGEGRRQEFTIFQPAAPRGAINFAPQFTDNAGFQGSGGSGFATLLTGQPAGGNINNINNVDYFRHVWAIFLHDDWRLSTKLTVNAGLRYEYFSPITERHDAQANFNPNTGELDIPASSNVSLTPTLATILTVNHKAPNALIAADRNNLGPRLGLAYQVNSRVVLRSAFGVFFNGDENGPYSNPSPGFNPPYFSSQSYNTPCSQSASTGSALDCSIPDLNVLSAGFSPNALLDPNTPNLFSENPQLRTPYVMQWHGTMQYQVGSGTVLEVAYVGSKGTKLYTFSNLNQAAPSADASAPSAPRRPFPVINTAISNLNGWGYSFYDGLQTKIEHRFGHGLSALANYTYSHALGNSSNANLGSQNNDAFRWSRHPEWEYGNLDFDVRHRFVSSYTWELPMGRNQPWFNRANAAENLLVSGWVTSGIVTLSSGTWFTVTDANANFANSDGQQRPDVVPGVKATDKPCVPGTSFNTCAFQDPAPGSFGDVGLNTLKGPGVMEWDPAVVKNFTLGESRRVEFRAELYNAFNHTNFQFAASGPQNGINSTVLGTSSFGYVTAARSPRQVQFALKFYY